MLRAALLASLVSIAMAQIYVPGLDPQDNPDAFLSTLGAGTDGFTTYVVEGVTLAENAASAIMSQFDTDGEVIYNCALGADNQATCSVSQVYDGVTYGYTEPITEFGSAASPTVSATSTSTSLSQTTPSTSILPPVASSSSTPTPSSTSTTVATSTSPSTSTSSSSPNLASPHSTTPGPSMLNPKTTAMTNIFVDTNASGRSLVFSINIAGVVLLLSLCLVL